jgi:hypothetical protein
MDNRGVVGIMALWLLTGTSALAMGTLAFSKRQESRSYWRLAETEALYLAYAGVQLAYANNFAAETRHHTFAQGEVTTTASIGSEGLLTLRISTQSKRLTKNFETGWKRVSGQWQAVFWREA